jgi:hypothetical protein
MHVIRAGRAYPASGAKAARVNSQARKRRATRDAAAVCAAAAFAIFESILRMRESRAPIAPGDQAVANCADSAGALRITRVAARFSRAAGYFDHQRRLIEPSGTRFALSRMSSQDATAYYVSEV